MNIFKSKMDWWITAILGFLLVYGIGNSIYGVWNLINKGLEESIYLVPGIIILLVLFGLVWPVKYIFDINKLIINSGLIRYKIPYESIISIEPSRNPLSSPALSLDRLKIIYGEKEKFILISPIDKKEFMKIITLKNNNLEFTGINVILKNTN